MRPLYTNTPIYIKSTISLAGIILLAACSMTPKQPPEHPLAFNPPETPHLLAKENLKTADFRTQLYAGLRDPGANIPRDIENTPDSQ